MRAARAWGQALTAKLKTAVLISGRGSNLQALIDACARPDFPAEIVLVLSNRSDAAGLGRAQQAGISVAIVDHKLYEGKAAFEAAMQAEIVRKQAELICLAGFMRLLSADFIEK